MKLFFSMLTACAFGIAISLIGILLFERLISVGDKEPEPVIPESEIHSADISILEEADQDPTFVSKFSRVFVYSADDGLDIIESAKKSIPHTANAKITAPSYVVLDMDRNAIILEKNSEKLLPIASVTKLVTAVVARKLINTDNQVVMSSKILATYGNEAKFRLNEKIKVEELIYPLLMVSSNDASEALASAHPKGRKEFIKEMNDWVNSIGAYRTYFADPSGLSPRNVSTTKDLAIITKWIYDNEPEIFNITLQKSYSMRTHTWTNPTHFLNLTSYAGGKNGYTPEANRTSVALFKLGRQQRLYGIMMLGSSARDADILDLLEEAIK